MPRKDGSSLADPNWDLVGKKIPTIGGDLTITGTTSWNPKYVDCQQSLFKTVRPIGLVRAYLAGER